MKITYKGDYALKAVLDLSTRYENGGVVPLSEIAARQDVPMHYLEQIMLVLKGAGYVSSKRGAGGGFALTKRPAEISVGEIVRQIEGPIEPIVCGKKIHDSSCGEENCCAFREVWLKVTEAISDIVDSVSFAHIMQRTQQLKEQNSSYTYQI
jgi:Rrf2 family protein